MARMKDDGSSPSMLGKLLSQERQLHQQTRFALQQLRQEHSQEVRRLENLMEGDQVEECNKLRKDLEQARGVARGIAVLHANTIGDVLREKSQRPDVFTPLDVPPEVQQIRERTRTEESPASPAQQPNSPTQSANVNVNNSAEPEPSLPSPVLPVSPVEAVGETAVGDVDVDLEDSDGWGDGDSDGWGNDDLDLA